MARVSALPRLCVGLCGAWLALWACAPPSVVAPMVPMNQEKGLDLGAALTGGAQLTNPQDWGAGEHELGDRYAATAMGGQVWAVQDMGRVDLGGTFGLLVPDANGDSGFHLGAMVRPHLVERENLLVGLDLELGVLWASVGLPVSVRASDRAWIYTDPSVGWRLSGICHVPLGVSVQTSDDVRLNAEVEYMTGAMGYVEGPLVVGTLGLSYRP